MNTTIGNKFITTTVEVSGEAILQVDLYRSSKSSRSDKRHADRRLIEVLKEHNRMNVTKKRLREKLEQKTKWD